MKNTVETGHNMTGMRYSPKDAALLAEAAAHTVPSMDGDESNITLVRAEYLAKRTKVGTMPPPAALKGAGLKGRARAAARAMGGNAAVLLDKIGERLAFERTGTRLYAALIDKFDAFEPDLGGPARDELVQIQGEELEHFELCRQSLIDLGGDPTALTPSADVASVSSMGLLQVMGDPRMNFRQSLEAVLIAELVDNESWASLVTLARALGHDELAEKFSGALAVEQQHLAEVRGWVTEMTLSDAVRIAD